MAEMIPAVPVNYDPITVPAGTAVGAAMREHELPNKGPEAVVVVRGADGTLYDLSHTPDTDAEFTPVAACEEDGRAVIRHSCGHVMAQAVQAEFPGTKLGIGPAIENGFYFDFQTAEPFTPEDLKACLLYTSPSPRDRTRSRMPSSA